MSYDTSAESLDEVGYDAADRGDHPAVIVFDPVTGAEVTRIPGPSGLLPPARFQPRRRVIALARRPTTASG